MDASIDNKTMRDNAFIRWMVLFLVASMMFFGYLFMDVMSPLKSLLESSLGWSSSNFGQYAASEYIANVLGFLIIAGIILDKMGVRFTGTLSASMMVIGAIIKYIGVSDWFDANEVGWLNSWWTTMPGTAKMAAMGFMIFGCGCEMAGTAVSKILAKWFKGKEMALAMGLEMAIARLGVFAAMWLVPLLSEKYQTNGINSITVPVAFCACLLCIGLLNFTIFNILDKKFDSELKLANLSDNQQNADEEFHISDLKQILTSKMFWLIALLCVLYYSAIFPFQKFAPNFLEETLNISNKDAAHLFSFFPVLAMCLTPFLGAFIDFKGKGATMLMIGAVIMVACHLSFAFLLPLFPNEVLAISLISILGVSFSLVPAALWPSVPKIIDEKVLGSAYCLIFWVQNLGLCFVPYIIGHIRDSTGNYLIPMITFSIFGILAFGFSILLKIEDIKKNYGLELPNKTK